MAALRTWSLAIAGAAVVVGVFTGLRRYLAFREARWIEADLRERLFAHFQRLHFAFHDRAQTGQLMSRANTDLQQIQAFVVMIPLTISNGVTVLAGHGHPVPHRPGAHRAGAREPAVPQRARHALLAAPAPRGDGHPAGVRRAGRGGRGDGRRRARREGLRRRAACRPARLRTEADDVFGCSMEAARVRATFLPGPRAAPEHRPDRGARLRRPPGAQRQPHPRPARRLQRLRRDADLAAADARDDHRPGPALGGRRRAGPRDPRHRPRDPRQPQRPAAARRRARRRARRGALRGRAVRATRPSCRWCSTASTSPCPPGSRSRWSAPPAAARPPSPG